MRQTFPKKEHLTGKTAFEELFHNGKSATSPPLRMIWMPSKISGPHRAGFTVPRRSFGKAVMRNRLKRRMREAYRKNKSILSELHPALDLLFIYSARDERGYDEIEQKMILSLRKLAHQMKGAA